MTRVSGERVLVASAWPEPAGKKYRNSTRASNRFLQFTALVVAGMIGAAAQADAAVFWSDSDSGYSRPAPVTPPRVQRSRRHKEKQVGATVKEAAKPRGPLIINVSINKQTVKIYDANGFFAEAPVSTGMAGHGTPMGAFSVIQKQKMHHSNIYSGAPMPFMQRITWSGVAMHAGVLPGYPASHGCIRMPMAFAVKMYGWTRMGARVIVTPGELAPAPFSHPLLVTQKVMPQPVAADVPKPDAAAKGDKVANAEAKPAAPEPNLELRSTVGHDSQLSAVMSEPAAPAPLSEQTHTADAGPSSETKATVTMSDATSSGPQAVPSDPVAPASEPAGHTDTVRAKVQSGASTSEAEPVSTKPGATASSNDKPVETSATAATTPELKTIEPATADQADQKRLGDATDVAKADMAKADAATAQTAVDVKASGPVADVSKVAEKPADDIPAASLAPANAADLKKDQGRVSDSEKVVAPKPALAMAKGTGPISVFISRKDGKLYVRQNFAPLFEVPVTIAPSDRPLGTHIFTAEADKNDANILHWSVVTLPASRKAARREDDERGARHRKIAGAVEIAKPVVEPDSPTEALDRITIPPDAMARITEALSTGGSIIVSDQGIAAGETGEGTDFIVSLR
jgi:lipoprotein-anchoring transpeptidase ErfK/SrfK